MIFSLRDSVVGLELCYDRLILAHVENSGKKSYKATSFQLPIPEGSIENFVIIDPESVAESIQECMSSHNIKVKNIVVGIQSPFFVKQSTDFPVLSAGNLRSQLELNLATHPFFHQKEFQLGFQRYRPFLADKDVDPEVESVLAVAIPNDVFIGIEELNLFLKMNLVAVECSALASIRYMLATQQETEPFIFISSHPGYLDVNVMYGSQILASHTFRGVVNNIMHHECAYETYATTVNQVLASISDRFPTADLPTKIIYDNQVKELDPLLDYICQHLELELCVLEPAKDIEESVAIIDGEGTLLDKQASMTAIGLGMRFFEPYNASVHISNIKKKVAPIFEKKTMRFYGGIATLCMVILVGVSGFFSVSTARLQADVDAAKSTIKQMQEDLATGREDKIDSIKKSMEFFGSISKKSSSLYAFFYDLVENLPSDIVFVSVSLNDSKKPVTGVSIKGKAYFQESIYRFYEELKQRYSKVRLGDITTTYNNENIGTHSFTVMFNWWKE